MKKIIPCLDIHRGRVVKGVNFVDLKDAGDPAEVAAYYCAQGADELVLLDVSATTENRETFVDVVEKVAEKITVPFTVGGGIRTLEDARKVLEAGASKVSLNSAAIKNPEVINQIAEVFGKNSLTIAVDSKKEADGKYYAYIAGGKVKTDFEVGAWCKEVAERGAGAILVTSIDFDGTKKGYDLELTRLVVASAPVEVIASGGAGTMEDFYLALTEGKADGALAASLFHFREIQVPELKKYLQSKGVEV